LNQAFVNDRKSGSSIWNNPITRRSFLKKSGAATVGAIVILSQARTYSQVTIPNCSGSDFSTLSFPHPPPSSQHYILECKKDADDPNLQITQNGNTFSRANLAVWFTTPISGIHIGIDVEGEAEGPYENELSHAFTFMPLKGKAKFYVRHNPWVGGTWDYSQVIYDTPVPVSGSPGPSTSYTNVQNSKQHHVHMVDRDTGAESDIPGTPFVAPIAATYRISPGSGLVYTVTIDAEFKVYAVDNYVYIGIVQYNVMLKWTSGAQFSISFGAGSSTSGGVGAGQTGTITSVRGPSPKNCEFLWAHKVIKEPSN
jgi:hypothetical protein